MRLHKIKSVRTMHEAGVYIAVADITDSSELRSDVDYVSRPDDHFGLADEVRAAIDAWIAAGKPVGPAE